MNYIHPPFPEPNSTQSRFSDLRRRVSLLNEPRCYNYLGIVIEQNLSAISDVASADYRELISIYEIFLQNFKDINEGAEWKSAFNIKSSML